MYLCCSDEWKETCNDASAIEYMGILETAAVLERIHKEFAGNSIIILCKICVIVLYTSGLNETRIFPDKILHSGEPNLIIVAPGKDFHPVVFFVINDTIIKRIDICTKTAT